MNLDDAITAALRNVAEHGDTDIFSFPFENLLFRDRLSDAAKLIKAIHAKPDHWLSVYPPETMRMLAYYVAWHRRVRLKPMLFDDEHLDEASAGRASPVVKAIRSLHAKAKDASRTADDGLPLHSFRTLLQDLGTLAYNVTHTRLNPEAKIIITTRPTSLQTKAFELLGLNPACTQ